MTERRKLLQALAGLGGLAFVGNASATEAHNDKRTLLAIFDKVGIPAADPSIDKTPNSISIEVNGDTVTGTEGGMVIFKFSAKGALTEVIVWNEKTNNTSVPE
jgi:hypothetical protein